MPVFSRFLRYFMVVAQQGSLRRAAEQLHIAASAIDRQILQGEIQFNVQLFERLPSGLRLTAAGELLLASCYRWTHEKDRLLTQFDQLKGLKQGETSILIPDALTKGFLPLLLGQLRQSHPGLTVSIHVCKSQDMNERLLKEEIDFALMFNPVPSRSLTMLISKNVPIGFITPVGHKISRLPEARFSLAAEYPMILPAAPLALWEPIRQMEEITGIRTNIIVRTDNTQIIKSLILEGAGIGILSALDVADEVQKGQLAFTPIIHERLTPLIFALCINRSRQISRAARFVIDEIEQFLARTM